MVTWTQMYMRWETGAIRSGLDPDNILLRCTRVAV